MGEHFSLSNVDSFLSFLRLFNLEFSWLVGLGLSLLLGLLSKELLADDLLFLGLLFCGNLLGRLPVGDLLAEREHIRERGIILLQVFHSLVSLLGNFFGLLRWLRIFRLNFLFFFFVVFLMRLGFLGFVSISFDLGPEFSLLA